MRSDSKSSFKSDNFSFNVFLFPLLEVCLFKKLFVKSESFSAALFKAAEMSYNS